MWTGLGMAAFVVLYWRYAQGELIGQRNAVMARQRAVAQALGPKILPFRDRVEAWVRELAGGEAATVVSPRASLDRIAEGPGAYFRVRQRDALEGRALRAAAERSLRDGFTSCLFVRQESKDGPPCRTPADCAAGQLCGELGVCGRPSQPFNLRLAYRALRVLQPEWAEELHRASTDLQVRAFELDLEAVTKNDVPLAIELLSRARFFTAVVDEDPPAGIPPPRPRPTGSSDPGETEEERLHRVAHPVRVGIWELASGELLARHRTDAAAGMVGAAGGGLLDPKIRAASQRQVNACAAALAVKELLAERGGAGPAAPR